MYIGYNLDMNGEMIEKLFADTAYIRVGGTDAERRCAEYLSAQCSALFGKEKGNAFLYPFDVQMGEIHTALLTVTDKNGTREIPCNGYMCAGSHEVEAPFFYLRAPDDKMSLASVRGKIVLFDGYLGYHLYQSLCEYGAVGFISYDGNVHFADRDKDKRELRSYVADANGTKCGREKLPGVHINAKDAVSLIENDTVTAKIKLLQYEYTGQSQNVILELPGTNASGEVIVLTAHYDSTPLSQGAYDNMSGAICLLSMAEYFMSHAHSRTLRFIWCGSEERGLLGSKAYCQKETDALKVICLCINVDMIGCTMGKFIACCTSEEALVHYIAYMGREEGFQVQAYQDVYSSDSTPFSDRGIPSVSFARSAPRETAMIHNAYDTAASIKTAQMNDDIAFITSFASRMANAEYMPVLRVIPDNMREKLDRYLCRKK